MPSPPSLAELIDRAEPGLGLAIETHDRERAPPLPAAPAGGELSTLVGHLNLVQPNRIQVLGHTETEFWNAQDVGERAELTERLLGQRPCGVIVSDALPVPPELREGAAAAGVPVLRADAGCEQVVRRLRDVLAALMAPATIVHGVFLDVLGTGVLLTGEGSVGKSEMALELVSRGHSLVADDAPEFRRDGEQVEGRAPPVLRDLLEVGGLGVLNIRAMYGDAAIREVKRLQLIIHLEPLTSALRGQIDRLNGNMSVTQVLGRGIDTMTLPVGPGRNLAVLAEAGVRNFLLIRRGYDAAADLMDRQQRRMNGEEQCD